MRLRSWAANSYAAIGPRWAWPESSRGPIRPTPARGNGSTTSEAHAPRPVAERRGSDRSTRMAAARHENEPQDVPVLGRIEARLFRHFSQNRRPARFGNCAQVRVPMAVVALGQKTSRPLASEASLASGHVACATATSAADTGAGAGPLFGKPQAEASEAAAPSAHIGSAVRIDAVPESHRTMLDRSALWSSGGQASESAPQSGTHPAEPTAAPILRPIGWAQLPSHTSPAVSDFDGPKPSVHGVDAIHAPEG
jgi:hypothetical protein